jgi:hypothetical protein
MSNSTVKAIRVRVRNPQSLVCAARIIFGRVATKDLPISSARWISPPIPSSIFSIWRGLVLSRACSHRLVWFGYLRRVFHVENEQIARNANANTSPRTTQGNTVVLVHFSAHNGTSFVAQVETSPDRHTAESPWGIGSLNQPICQSYQH